MTDLRDARLHRALQEAPDAQLRPDARTRQQVLDAARAAVAPVPRVPWWESLWHGSGDRRMPWNAALATVVLASMVTVLWYEREVPGARTDSAGPDQRAPAVPPQSAPAPAPAPAAPALQPAPEAAIRPPPGPASEPAAKSLPSPAPARRVAPAQKAQPQAADTQRPPPALDVQREPRAETPVDALRDREVRELGKGGPQKAEAFGPAEAAGARAPAPAAPAVPQEPAVAPMARSAPPGLTSQRAASATDDWSHVRVTHQARSVELARDQVPRLADLASGIVRDTQSREPLEAPVSARIEFRRAGELSGVIELAGPQVRWTRWRGGQSESFTARPESARLQLLRDEVERLLQR